MAVPRKKKPGPEELDLATLRRGLPGVSPARGRAFAEAAAISLHRQGHKSGVELLLAGVLKKSFALQYPRITRQIDKSWADQDEATEDGACAMAFVLTMRVTDFTVIERSAKGTGIDYWLGYVSELPFQRAARLEVSGIAKGDESAIARRVQQKKEQSRKSAGSLKAYVCVTEFGTPTSRLVRA